MIRYARILWSALCAMILLASVAAAQLPAPFAYIPGDVEGIGRIDLQKVGENPQLAQVLQSAAERQANYQAHLLLDAYKNTAGNIDQLIEGFPGQVLILESGTREVTAAQNPTYQIAYGRFDGAAIAKQLTAAGWIKGETYKNSTIFIDPNRLVCLTMPNAWTIFTTYGPTDMKKMIDLVEQPNAPTALAQSSKSIAGSGGAAGRSYVFFNLEMSPDLVNRIMSVAMDAAAAQGQVMNEQMKAQAKSEITNMTQGVTSVLFSVAENQGLRLNFAVDCVDEQSRNRVVTQLQQAISIAGTMMYSQAQGDPDVQALAQTLQMAQFQTNGNRAYLSIIVPPAAIDKVIQGIKSGNAGPMAP
ncbi:hypothetical protein KQI84_17000 [bacterium]|nr:hypothetical protein [bacterium]